MSQPNPSSTEPKKYFLSKEEIAQVDSRHQLIKQYQYLIHIINADIQGYIQFVVMDRCKIPKGKNYILSQDNTYITLPGGEVEKEEKHDPVKTE